jgi:hypothetical protein
VDERTRKHLGIERRIVANWLAILEPQPQVVPLPPSDANSLRGGGGRLKGGERDRSAGFHVLNIPTLKPSKRSLVQRGIVTKQQSIPHVGERVPIFTVDSIDSGDSQGDCASIPSASIRSNIAGTLCVMSIGFCNILIVNVVILK